MLGSTLIFSFSSGPKLPSISMVITASPPRLCLDRRKLQIFTPASAMTSVTAAMVPGASRWSTIRVVCCPVMDTSMPLTSFTSIFPPPMLLPKSETVLPAASVRVTLAVLGWAPSMSPVAMFTSNPCSLASSGALRIRLSSVAIPMIPAMRALSVPWPL